ncbi:MAG: cytochrome c [Deltaproteobacteria bacterium]|nr:cytochrome c [Deltaproteobacteria bacterium]
MKRDIFGLVVSFGLLSAGTAFAQDGAELFAKTCATCHGKDGKGETMIGKKLQIKNLVATEKTDADIEAQIINGKKGEDGKDRMPALKGALTPEQIKAIVGYVRANIVAKK